MKNIIKKNYETLIIIIMLAIIILLNIESYFKRVFYSSFFPIKEANAFSFWWYILNYNLGQILIYLSPIIIAFVAVLKFHKILASGFYQNILLRMEYKKYIVSELQKCYLKGAIILPLLSIVILLIGIIILPTSISTINSSNPVLYISTAMSNNIALFILYSIVMQVMYSILIINISLICCYYASRFSLVILGTFVIVNGINFIVSNIGVLIANITNSELLYKFAINLNIYDGYFPYDYTWSFIFIFVGLILSFCFLYIVYKKKFGLVKRHG